MRGYQRIDSTPPQQNIACKPRSASQEIENFSCDIPLSHCEQRDVLVTQPPLLHDKVHAFKSGTNCTANNHHVTDLDEFFTRIYEYHKRKGFWCIVVEDSLELLRFTFVALFLIFLCTCVDYEILFRDKLLQRNNQSAYKVTLKDAIQFDSSKLDFSLVLCSLIAGTFWLYWFLVLVWKIRRNLSTSRFYVDVLNLQDKVLENLKWSDILNVLMIAQKRHQFCMNKTSLNEMDICHQILRRKNYLVALVNKNVLPVKFNAPLIGEVTFFTNGFKFNFEFLFFLGWYSPWKDYWRLKAEYKNSDYIEELSKHTEKVVFWLALLNFLLSPIIFVWQIFYSLFSYGELIKREPGLLGTRRWSIYGKYFLRHFNELDHELDYRLSLAYRPSCQYLDMFKSDMLDIVAKNLIFFLGAPVLVLLALSVYDEDVLQVQHVLTIITVLGLVIAVCKSLMTNENQIFCPELMLKILANHLCYVPDHWRGKAHTVCVRREFSQLFQYTACFVLEELFSPLVTPFVLLFWLRPRCREILEFFRKFTIEVPSLGDVCSFAVLDVRKHGDKMWRADSEQHHPFDQCETDSSGESPVFSANHGKREISLIRFQTANPRWRPNQASSRRFLASLKARCDRDAAAIADDDFMSLAADSKAAPASCTDANALLQSLASLPAPYYFALMTSSVPPTSGKVGNSVHVDGGSLALTSLRRAIASTSSRSLMTSSAITFFNRRPNLTSNSLDSQVLQSLFLNRSTANQMTFERLTADDANMDMVLTAAYLRELHNRRLQTSYVRSYGSMQFAVAGGNTLGAPLAFHSPSDGHHPGSHFAAIVPAMSGIDSLVPLSSATDSRTKPEANADKLIVGEDDFLWNVPRSKAVNVKFSETTVDRKETDGEETEDEEDQHETLYMPRLHYNV